MQQGNPTNNRKSDTPQKKQNNKQIEITFYFKNWIFTADIQKTEKIFWIIKKFVKFNSVPSEHQKFHLLLKIFTYKM